MSSSSSRPSLISVSGITVDHKEFGASPGDIYLYRRDDSNGRSARKGGHTNFGYSGYFLASIYDGKEWRKLQFNQIVPYEMRSYERASDAGVVAAQLQQTIAQWLGRTATYNAESRSFIF